MKLNVCCLYALFILLSLGCHSCTEVTTPPTTTFSGKAKAIKKAEQMFEAIGGKTAWCGIKSLYVKAEHTEPQLTIPYTNEIWRAMDSFKLVIEQKSDSFHVKAVVTAEGGQIRYYDKRDTVRTLTEAQLTDWEFSHDHNVYVLLHNLACNPSHYRVSIDEQEKLVFHQDTTFVTSFGLDEQMRPHLFYQPNPDGSISASNFTRWLTDDGLVHSAGGHPLDSSFIYRTEVWQPSTNSLEESFGSDVFDF